MGARVSVRVVPNMEALPPPKLIRNHYVMLLPGGKGARYLESHLAAVEVERDGGKQGVPMR